MSIVVFGGSWYDYPQSARVALRAGRTRLLRYALGLRLAKSLGQSMAR